MSTLHSIKDCRGASFCHKLFEKSFLRLTKKLDGYRYNTKSATTKQEGQKMKEKILRRVGVQMMGAAAALCMTGIYNPVGFAYFAALYLEKGQRLITFPLIFAIMAAVMPAIPAIKYLLAMMSFAVLIGFWEVRRGKTGKTAAGVLAGICVLAIQSAGAFMGKNTQYELFAGVCEGLLVFALTQIFRTGIKAVLFKKSYETLSNEETAAVGILFGILLYALKGQRIFTVAVAPACMYLGILLFSYRHGIGMGAMAGAACGMVMTLWHGDGSMLGMFCALGIMAGIFRMLGRLGSVAGFLAGSWILGNLYAPFLLEMDNLMGAASGSILFLLLPGSMAFRIETGAGSMMLDSSIEEKKGRLTELAGSFKALARSIGRFHSQNDLSFAAAVQLSETAALLEDMTQQMGEYKMRGKQEEAVMRALERARMEVRYVRIIRQQNGRDRLQIEMRSLGGRIVTVREACTYIGRGYGKKVRACSDGKAIVNGEFAVYGFVEEPNFMVLHGVSGVTKTGETISGDNFSCTELMEGQLLMGIVDGMGSGGEASGDSEEIIGLLEDLLKAGYEEETALRLVNSVLLGKENGEASAAIDLAITDLYSGKCNFYKSGAAATFIKRNQWVEVMKSTSLPIGVLKDVDYEAACKKLYDGDYIVMVSDGVLEAFESENKEEELGRLLMDIDTKNPKEMADKLLTAVREYTGQKIMDDMTVLVTGIWQKAA